MNPGSRNPCSSPLLEDVGLFSNWQPNQRLAPLNIHELFTVLRTFTRCLVSITEENVKHVKLQANYEDTLFLLYILQG